MGALQVRLHDTSIETKQKGQCARMLPHIQKKPSHTPINLHLKLGLKLQSKHTRTRPYRLTWAVRNIAANLGDYLSQVKSAEKTLLNDAHITQIGIVQIFACICSHQGLAEFALTRAFERAPYRSYWASCHIWQGRVSWDKVGQI